MNKVKSYRILLIALFVSWNLTEFLANVPEVKCIIFDQSNWRLYIFTLSICNKV